MEILFSDCSYFSDEITFPEVEQALSHMNSNKAPGVDEIKASSVVDPGFSTRGGGLVHYCYGGICNCTFAP